MYGLSKRVVESLQSLKQNFGVQGLKAEFEAEGASFRDLVRLRYLTALAGVKLYVKIGGVEAIRDIKDCFELGVDGLIAPMVETSFGVAKFLEATQKVFKDEKVPLTINVETRNAIEEIDDIIAHSRGKIDNVTLGRTDLSGSYFSPSVTPDCDFILDTIEKVGHKLKGTGISLTVGGSLGAGSIRAMRARPVLCELVKKLETRKVMFPTKVAIEQEGAIREALKFEELFILSKKELSDLMIEADVHRLTQLTRRS